MKKADILLDAVGSLSPSPNWTLHRIGPVSWTVYDYPWIFLSIVLKLTAYWVLTVSVKWEKIVFVHEVLSVYVSILHELHVNQIDGPDGFGACVRDFNELHMDQILWDNSGLE